MPVLQDAPGSSSVFPVSVLESVILPRNTSSFVLETSIRNQDVSAKAAYYYWGVVSFRSSQLIDKIYIHVYIYIHVC